MELKITEYKGSIKVELGKPTPPKWLPYKEEVPHVLEFKHKRKIGLRVKSTIAAKYIKIT